MFVPDSIRPDAIPGFDSYIPPDFVKMYTGKNSSQRMIYYEDEHVYNQKELDEISKFKVWSADAGEYLLPEWFLDEEVLRTLYENDFSYSLTLTNIKLSIDFFSNRLPMKLNDAHVNVLTSGCFSFFGRDKYFRPVFILKPVCLTTLDNSITDEEIAEAIVFACYYAKQNMLVKGKIESWVMIYDI